MHSAQRATRVVLLAAVFGCLAVVTACGDDDDSGGAVADGGVVTTTPTDDGGDGGDAPTRGECSIVDLETVEELFGIDLEIDIAEGFSGSALCNFSDPVADAYTVLISKIEIDGEAQYQEGITGLTDASPVDVGDEAVARMSDGDFGGSVDLHAVQGDVYVTCSTTFPPEGDGAASLSACTELAGQLL